MTDQVLKLLAEWLDAKAEVDLKKAMDDFSYAPYGGMSDRDTGDENEEADSKASRLFQQAQVALNELIDQRVTEALNVVFSGLQNQNPCREIDVGQSNSDHKRYYDSFVGG